jgi:Short C-terminal domain
MGLLGGMARTAVVAGTATAVSNRVSRRQANRWAAQDQSAYAQPQYAQPQYAPPQYAPPQYAPPQYAPPQYAPPQYAEPQYAPPAPAPAPDPIAQLEKLAELKDQGILTDAEFQAAKAKILAS